MKDKILVIAVAASAGYAGGKMGAAPPENITAKSISAESVMVGKPGHPDGWVLVVPGMVNLTGPKGMSDPHVTLFYDPSAKDASVMVSGGG
jgi:hypothetical protein